MAFRISRFPRRAPCSAHGAGRWLLAAAAVFVAAACSSDDIAAVHAANSEGMPPVHHDSGASVSGEATPDGGASSRDAATLHPTDAGFDSPAKVPDALVPIDARPDARPEGSSELDGAPPVSLRCGDGIRGPDEECDDGNADDADFCTSLCRVRDRLAVGPTDPPAPIAKLRSIPTGQHVVATGTSGAALLFVDDSASPEALGIVMFDKTGRRRPTAAGVVVSDTDPIHEPADAHVVALPNNQYAVVWTASSGSSLHIALRIVNGTSGALSDVVPASSLDYDAEF